MINLTKVADNLEAIPSNQREAIINLIDIKVESDMEKVLQKLDSMETKLDAKIDALETKFDTKIDALNTKIDALDAKFSNKFKSMYWLLGAVVVLFPLSPTVNKLLTYLSSMIPAIPQ